MWPAVPPRRCGSSWGSPSSCSARSSPRSAALLGAAFFRRDVPPALGGDPFGPPPLPPQCSSVQCSSSYSLPTATDILSAMSDPKVPAEIADLLQEDRTFPPPEAFRAQANVSDPEVYARAERDPEGFWAGFARELEWFTPWTQVLDWKPPHAKWFVGGTHQRQRQLRRSPRARAAPQQGRASSGKASPAIAGR